MPRDISGTYIPARDWTTDASNSVPFSAEKFDEQDGDFADAINEFPHPDKVVRFADPSAAPESVPPGTLKELSGEIYIRNIAGAWVSLDDDVEHRARTDNPHSVTKSQVGLGNADNTSDVNKPISTATQTAIDALETAVDVLGNELKTYALSSLAVAAAFEIPAAQVSIETLNYANPGDGGGGRLIRRTGAYATYPLIMTDALGGEWVYDPAQRFNPMMFGAIGDGTADDAAELNLAITRTPDNSVLDLMGRTYGIGAAGVVMSGRTSLWIEGNGAKFKPIALPTQNQAPMSFGSTLFKIDSCTGGGVRNLEVDGSGYATNGIGLVQCTGVTVEGCIVYNCGAQALITVLGGSRNRVINNLARDSVSPARGFWFGNVNAIELETDIHISGNTSVDHGASAFVITADGAMFVGNHGEGCAGAGLAISGNNTVNSRNVMVVGNKLHDNVFQGVQSDISGSGICYNVTIAGNSLRRNTQNGVMAYRVRNWVISGNDCSDNGNAGVLVTYDSASITISGNDCSDTRTGGARTQIAGIQVIANGGDIDDVLIAGNTTCNNTSIGVQVVNAGTDQIRGVSIVGGIASDNSGYGVFSAEVATGDVTGLLISGIRAENNTTADIRSYNKDVVLGANHYATQAGLDMMDLDTGTTPSVGSRRQWTANNGAATTVTALNGAANGHEIVIRGLNANTTLQHNASIVLNGAVNAAIPTNGSITLVKNGGVWFETSRSF